LFGLLVLLLVLVGLYFFKNKDKAKVPGVRPKVLSDLYAKDLAVLENPKSEERDLISSLTRLGRAKDPLAYEFAMESLKQSSQSLRLAAIKSLGYFETQEAELLLQGILEQSDRQQRLAAIEALGFLMSEKRREVLQKFSEKKDLNVLEKFEVGMVLTQSGPVEKRNEQIEALVNLVSQMDAELRLPNILRVITLAPKHEAIRKFFLHEIQRNQNLELTQVGKSYLQSF
jgi:HEAT repeat protein